MRRHVLLSPKGFDRQSKKATRSYYPIPSRGPKPFLKTTRIDAVSEQDQVLPMRPMTDPASGATTVEVPQKVRFQ